MRSVITTIWLSLFLCNGWMARAQMSSAYTHEWTSYREGLELYDKEKYSAALEAFDGFLRSGAVDRHHEAYVNASFHAAMSTVWLKRNDAEKRLLDFEHDFPHSPQVQSAYFQLGKLYFDRKDYKRSLEWFDKTDKFKLDTEQLAEYYFKTGFAYNQLGKRQEAFLAFAEIKGTDNAYRYPALYYYSHMAYEDKNHQVALEGFLQLSEANVFMSVVPYYIAQIYFMQKKYEQVITYAKPLIDTGGSKRSAELNQMLGNSFFELKKYEEALPYLEKYAALQTQDRKDLYRLGYAYYMSQKYDQAILRLGKVTYEDDEMCQNAWYHMGDCYIRTNRKKEAQNAYDRARKMNFQYNVSEDAFYKYAQLTYELSYNPYHDAIRVMNEYLKKYPGNIHREEVYTFLINMLVAGKNYETAYETLQEITNRNLDMQRAYQFVVYNLGVDLLNKKQYPEAEKKLKEVKTYPLDKKLNALSVYYQAECKYLSKEYTPAILGYKDFMQQPGAFRLPEYNRSNYHIGYSYLQMAYAENEDAARTGKVEMGNYLAALDHFRRFATDDKEKDMNRVADAYLRIGDIYYVRSDNENAAKFYDQALKAHPGDYARFQKAMSDGLLGKKNDKITGLKELLRAYPHSRFTADAKFEIAQTYATLDKKQDALTYYQMVIKEHPDNIARVKHSYFGTALLYYQLKDYKNSETTYRTILDKYPNPVDQREAFNRMKAVYADQNKVDEWIALMKKYDLYNSNQFAADSAYFENAESHYQSGDWSKAITSLEKYLKEFNPPRFALQANFYLADAWVANGKPENAVPYFEFVITQPSNIYTEHSILSCARIHEQLKQDDKALEKFELLEKTAAKADHVSEARLAIMKIYCKMENWEKAAEYAQKVLLDAPKDDELKADCHYLIGKNHLQQEDYATAKTEFEKVVKLTKTEKRAESSYYLCYFKHVAQQYKPAEKDLYDFFKQKPTYSYWLAKGYILLGINYAAQGDTVQAKATLQSVLDNYKKTDDDILDNAQMELQKLTPPPTVKAPAPGGEIEVVPNENENGTEEPKLEEPNEENHEHDE